MNKQYVSSIVSGYPDLKGEDWQAEIAVNNASVYKFYVPVRSRWNLAELPKEYRQLNEKNLADANEKLAKSNLDAQKKPLSGYQTNGGTEPPMARTAFSDRQRR